MLLLNSTRDMPAAAPDIFIVFSEDALVEALVLAEQCRNAMPSAMVVLNTGGGSFKNQFKRADRSGANIALVLGEDEVSKQVVTAKFLRDEREQQEVPFGTLSAFLRQHLLA